MLEPFRPRDMIFQKPSSIKKPGYQLPRIRTRRNSAVQSGKGSAPTSEAQAYPENDYWVSNTRLESKRGAGHVLCW